ncbi:hypothetical protein GQ42DRAFT_70279 [Ramicandelaber brevisporus]|nr:hypothetical protein GQ42DRAFT_70279 [Ramicandelaber brevisporus]
MKPNQDTLASIYSLLSTGSAADEFLAKLFKVLFIDIPSPYFEWIDNNTRIYIPVRKDFRNHIVVPIFSMNQPEVIYELLRQYNFTIEHSIAARSKLWIQHRNCVLAESERFLLIHTDGERLLNEHRERMRAMAESVAARAIFSQIVDGMPVSQAMASISAITAGPQSMARQQGSGSIAMQPPTATTVHMPQFSHASARPALPPFQELVSKLTPTQNSTSDDCTNNDMDIVDDSIPPV